MNYDLMILGAFALPIILAILSTPRTRKAAWRALWR